MMVDGFIIRSVTPETHAMNTLQSHSMRRIWVMAMTIVVMCTIGGCNENADTPARSASDPKPPTVAAVSSTTVLRFKVTGMHCQGCADGIKGTLESLPGVIEADASFADGEATVKTSDPTIGPKVIESITAMQFEAELKDQG
jgi:copper chaperone CopZ